MRKLLTPIVAALSILPTGSFAQISDFNKTKAQNETESLSNDLNIRYTASEQLLSTLQDNKYGLNENTINNSSEEQNLNEGQEMKNKGYMILIVYILSMYCFGIGYPLKIEYDEIKDYMKKMKIRLDSSDDFKEILRELIELYNLNGKEDLFENFAKSFAYNYMFGLNNKSDTGSKKINKEAISDVFIASLKKTFSEYCKNEPTESLYLCDVLLKIFIDYLEKDKKELKKTLFGKRCFT